MQLGGGPASGPQPRNAADAIVRGASALGHRPAVSLLLPSGRQEQSGASLAQWAAKGAHLLELDLLLEPGDEVRLDAPWSWTTAAIALAVWWAGGIVRVEGGGEADIAVIGPHGDAAGASEVFVVGDGIDGAPEGASQDGPVAWSDAWTRAAQPFPDQPPPPRATPELPAIRQGARQLDQHAALDLAASLGTSGTLALYVTSPGPTTRPGEASAGHQIDTATALAMVALRPLLSGRPTVILRGVEPAVAAGDRIERWARTI